MSNSGFRANQVMSISEHFEMNFTVPAATVNMPVAGSGDPPSTDYLYQPSADIDRCHAGGVGLDARLPWDRAQAGPASRQSAGHQSGERPGNSGPAHECRQHEDGSQIQRHRRDASSKRSAEI